MNHFLDINQTILGTVYPVPDRNSVANTNGLTGVGSLTVQAQLCAAEHGYLPTFTLVDYFDVGNVFRTFFLLFSLPLFSRFFGILFPFSHLLSHAKFWLKERGLTTTFSSENRIRRNAEFSLLYSCCDYERYLRNSYFICWIRNDDFGWRSRGIQALGIECEDTIHLNVKCCDRFVDDDRNGGSIRLRCGRRK